MIVKARARKNVLNEHEFFKMKNVLKEELKKGNDPEVIYYRDNEKNPFTIYIVRNGFHDYVAHAKRESLVLKKVEAIKEYKIYLQAAIQEA